MVVLIVELLIFSIIEHLIPARAHGSHTIVWLLRIKFFTKILCSNFALPNTRLFSRILSIRSFITRSFIFLSFSNMNSMVEYYWFCCPPLILWLHLLVCYLVGWDWKQNWFFIRLTLSSALRNISTLAIWLLIVVSIGIDNEEYSLTLLWKTFIMLTFECMNRCLKSIRLDGI